MMSASVSIRVAVASAIALQVVSLLFYRFGRVSHKLLEISTPQETQTLARPYGKFCETSVIGEKQTWNPRKKVISYALFSGNSNGTLDDWLMDGIKYNVNGALLYYPDWVTRVHVMGVSQDVIQTILGLSDSVEVVKCHESSPLNRSSSHKMVTRFLPYDDPTVYYTIVRDLDSRFSPRELLAVNEWISSDQLFHVMRDHRYHIHPIMGGMFGMKYACLGFNKDNGSTTMTEMIEKAVEEQPDEIPGSCHGYDQCFLESYIWPRVKHNTMDHDLVLIRCQKYGSAVCREWPIGKHSEATNHFVGAMFKEDHLFPSSVVGYLCELQCKPK